MDHSSPSTVVIAQVKLDFEAATDLPMINTKWKIDGHDKFDTH